MLRTALIDAMARDGGGRLMAAVTGDAARRRRADRDQARRGPGGADARRRARAARARRAVLVQAGAGRGASIPDDDFARAGAEIVASADEVWERAGLICKVKEPQPDELAYLRDDLVLFTYLHLAAYPEVADALLDAGHHRHRLRDGPDRRRRAAAARADERGGRADVGAGRGPLPRTPQRRPGRPARRRAGRAAGAGRGHRRRQRRLERGLDGRRPGGGGEPARPEHRPPADGRPDPDGSDHDLGVEPGTGRAGRSPAPTSSSAPCSWPAVAPRSWWTRTSSGR